MKAAAVFARVLLCLALVAGGAVAPAVALTAEELAGYKQRAEQGSYDAQYELGLYYRKGGKGVERDGAEAVKWFRLASAQGFNYASYWIGEMYFNGEGVEKDETEAVKWFRLALKQGLDEAQFMLAKAYEEGRGVEKDEAEAIKRYRLAAQGYSAPAKYRVGLMYEEGKGVEKDEVEAFKWFHRAGWNNAGKKLFEIFHPAAERGEAYPQYEIGDAYFYGRGLKKDKAEGLKWLRLAAEQGYVKAQAMLGEMYSFGEGDVLKDEVEGLKWWRLAAKQGDTKSQYRLGVLYLNGFGVEKDISEGLMLWRRAEKQGGYLSRWGLGDLHFYGKLIPQNYYKAYILLSSSYSSSKNITKARANLTSAQIKSADEEIQKIEERDKKRRKAKEKAEEEAALAWRRANVVPDLRRKGDAYYKGKGVLPNYKEAAKWYRQAAERGDAEAQYRLGLMYAEGKRGIEQNHVEAYIWLALAGVNDTGEIGEKAASLRESVEKNLTAEQFEQAQAEATKRLQAMQK